MATGWPPPCGGGHLQRPGDRDRVGRRRRRLVRPSPRAPRDHPARRPAQVSGARWPSPTRRWLRCFDYRFADDVLSGHSLGNLILAALMDRAHDPVEALDEACRLLGVRGRVLPATTEPVVLKAESRTAARSPVRSRSWRPDHIRRVSLVPSDPAAPPRRSTRWPTRTRSCSVQARSSRACWPRSPFRGSGTGSHGSRARKVYVCNLRPQVPETEDFDVAMHVDALVAHGVVGRRRPRRHVGSRARKPCQPRWSTPPWHDRTGWPTIPTKLAAALSDLLK